MAHAHCVGDADDLHYSQLGIHRKASTKAERGENTKGYRGQSESSGKGEERIREQIDPSLHRD